MTPRRRLLLAALAAPLARPFGAVAQRDKAHRIGLLLPSAAQGGHMEHFFRGLRELGYVEGSNLTVERRYAEGRDDRYPALAAELVKLPVDVLLAAGPAATRAAKAATSTVPIVMGTVDPVEQGLIQSLARPGGNMTGWCLLSTEGAQKQLSILKEALPRALRVGVVATPTMVKHVNRTGELAKGARELGLTLAFVEIAGEEALEAAFAALRRERVDAFILVAEPSLDRLADRIAALAARDKLPGMYSFRPYVVAGGLMAYGPSLRALVELWPAYVDRILKGANPGELPVQTPTKYELVVNQRVANELGVAFPAPLLLAADVVVR
jgi:putative ABC transport system substrate-binding protein